MIYYSGIGGSMNKNSKRPLIFENKYRSGMCQPYEAIVICLGYALIPLVDKEKGAPLFEEDNKCRDAIEKEYGIILPRILFTDYEYLPPTGYCIYIYGDKVAGYELKEGHLLCIDTGHVEEPVDISSFERTKDPAYDLEAFWVPTDKKRELENYNYTCVEPATIIGVHLRKVIQDNFKKIVNQRFVNELINRQRSINPDVIDNLLLKQEFPISTLKMILCQLLMEDVSVCGLTNILEAISDYYSAGEKDMFHLIEKVRLTIAERIIKKYADDNNNVYVINVSRKMTEFLKEHIYYPESKIEHPYFCFEKGGDKKLMEKVSSAIHVLIEKNYPFVIFCSNAIRSTLSDYLRRVGFNGMRCISYEEADVTRNQFKFKIEVEIKLDDE